MLIKQSARLDWGHSGEQNKRGACPRGTKRKATLIIQHGIRKGKVQKGPRSNGVGVKEVFYPCENPPNATCWSRLSAQGLDSRLVGPPSGVRSASPAGLCCPVWLPTLGQPETPELSRVGSPWLTVNSGRSCWRVVKVRTRLSGPGVGKGWRAQNTGLDAVQSPALPEPRGHASPLAPPRLLRKPTGHTCTGNRSMGRAPLLAHGAGSILRRGGWTQLHPILPDLCKSSQRCTEDRIQSKRHEDFWQQHKNCESEKGIIYPEYSLNAACSR
ncbi:hypothetical protein R6Z07M_012340 [Ovis aries]